MTVLHSLVASSGTVTFFKGWDLTGNYTFVDLVAASTNALNGALLARRPDHFKNFTIVGILGMALLGGLGGGITRDVLLGDVPSALTNPAYITLALLFGLIGYSVAYKGGQLFREGLFQFMTSFSLPWYAIVGAQKGVGQGIPILGCILLAVVGPTAGRWYIDVSSGVTPKQFIRGEWFVTIAAFTGLVWILVYWASGNTWVALGVAFFAGYISRVLCLWYAWEEPLAKEPDRCLQALRRAADARPQAEGKVTTRAPRPRSARRGCRFAGRGRGRACDTDRRELMADTPTDVLVGAYPDIDAATNDFDALAKAVEAKQVKMEAAILITHAKDGTVTVEQTADHRGRKGVEWGGAVGVLVGLAAPPLLAATAIGAVAGGLIGRFVNHRVETQMHDKIGENLPPGTAGIIAAFDDSQRFGVEQTLPGALAKSIVQTDKKGLKALQGSLAEAMGKFVPDRTVLPLPDKNFGGSMGHTIDGSVADWSIIPGPKAPEGAPNVLLVLIDDAGFGQPDTFGGPVSTPNLTRVGQMGLYYNRYHVVALCSPTRAATLTGRNQHRVGMGSVAEFPGPFPGYTGAVPRPACRSRASCGRTAT